MPDDMFSGMDEGVGLEKAVAPSPMRRTFQDWRRDHGSCRIGLRGEDGDLQAWDALFVAIGWDRLSTAYKILRKRHGQAVWYSAVVAHLEEENARAINAAIAPVRDWRPVLLDFMRTPKPTAAQASAIAYLRKLAKDRGVYSLNLTKAVLGTRELLPEPTDATVAATLGGDSSVVQRLVAKGFIK